MIQWTCEHNADLFLNTFICTCILFFSSLVKMVYGFADKSDDKYISNVELEQAIKRNFSGLDDLNPMNIFSRHLPQLKPYFKVNTITVYEIQSHI